MLSPRGRCECTFSAPGPEFKLNRDGHGNPDIKPDLTVIGSRPLLGRMPSMIVTSKTMRFLFIPSKLTAVRHR